MKIQIKALYIIVLFTQITLCNFFCQNDASILQNIKAIEKTYIGEGSFGKIYGNESEVSKTMKTEDTTSLLLLNNELKIMAAFRQEHDMMQLHSNQCWFKKLHFLTDYEVKIKMDRMESDLKKAITSNPFRANIFWKFDMLFKLATSLKKLHDIGILHLDLKEQNIMMMNKYTPVLADFGMAKLPNEQRKFVGGTPLFMSPEINQGIYKDSADIFALGIIFFQLLNQRFVSSQSFRKLCDYNEFYYDKAYCAYDKLVNQMLNSNYSYRPKINEVIYQILQGMKNQFASQQQQFADFLSQEKEYLKSNGLSSATKKNKEQLLNKFYERVQIYRAAIENNQNKQTLQQMVNNYCKPQGEPLQYLNRYNDKYAFVGPTQQDIKKMDQTFIQQDEQKSILNLQNRMNFAEQSRIKVLDQKFMFKQNEIEDNHINLPKVQLHKKAISNNIAAQFQQHQVQKKFGLDNGAQQIVNKLNLSPQRQKQQPQYFYNQDLKKYELKLPPVNYQQQQINALYNHKPQQVVYQNQIQGHQNNLPQVHHHVQKQIVPVQNNNFNIPNQHLAVNHFQQHQQPITRPGFDQYQINKNRQNVDSVGGLIYGGVDKNFRHQKFNNNNFGGRFII